MKKTGFLIGRLIFGGFFLYNGINHIVHKDQLAGYAGAKKVPMPEAAVVGSGALLIASGVSVILGIRPKLGAAGIIAFLASVSPSIHDFWTAQDPAQKQNDMIHFMKNMALLGAALTLMGVEDWPVSISD